MADGGRATSVSDAGLPEEPAPSGTDGYFGRMFRSVRTRNFRLFLIGQSVSAVGIWVQRVAELWLVLELTRSSVAVGLVTTCNFLPVLLLGPWGGLIADRTDKRRLLVITQSLRAVPAFLLAGVTLAGMVEPWIVYAVAILTGTTTAFDNPARRVFLQELVGRGLAANAISLNSTMMTSARVTGPAIAGLVISLVDIGWAFALNGLTYLAVIVSLWSMRPQELERLPHSPRGPGQLLDGFRYVAATPQVRSALVMLAIVATFSWGSLEVLIPLLVAFVFEGDAGAFAALFAVMGAGAMAGALSSAARVEVRLEHAAVAAAALGLLLTVTAAASTPWVAGILLFLVGIAGAWFVATDNAVVLVMSEDRYSGRVLALYSTLQLGSRAVGGVLVGGIAGLVGSRGAFVFAGLTALLAGVPVLISSLRVKRAPAVLHRTGTRDALDAPVDSDQG